MGDIIERLRKKTTLRIRLKVHNEMLIQNYLVDNGYIPDGYWSDEKEEKYGSFRELAVKIADMAIDEMNEWEKDGRPNEND